MQGSEMKNDVNRQWVLKKRPPRAIEPDTFELKEGPIPEPKEGQMLVRNLYLSFDPALRGQLNDVKSYVPPVQIGEVMRASGVAQVIESKNADYKEGDFVQAQLGWQDFAVISDGGFVPPRKVPKGIPITQSLSVLGTTGLTAYFGILDIARPKEGDVVVVSGAAGATGSVAGQIAKIKGAETVVGIAGGKEKCDWLTGEAHFDAAIDYKNEDVGKALDKHCPEGMNIYFDNVGGEILNACLARLKLHACVALCGGISSGYGVDRGPGPANYFNLVITRSRMEGFLLPDYLDKFPEAVAQLQQWVSEGKIAYKEDIADGLEKAPEALQGLFEGKNFGKQLLKIADPPIEP